MTVWHELSRFIIGLSQYSEDNKTRQIVRRRDQEPELFEAYFVRQTQIKMHPPPEECVQLWPIEPILESTEQEAKEKALLLLEIAASGSQDELFEKRSCPVPLHRKKVKEVQSSTHQAFAFLYKHTSSRYEARYFGAVMDCDYEDGWRLSVPPVADMPVPEGFVMLTFAGSLEDVEQIALEELALVVVNDNIKPR